MAPTGTSTSFISFSETKGITVLTALPSGRLPSRKAVIRLASVAENAQQPAPHMNPPRLIGDALPEPAASADPVIIIHGIVDSEFVERARKALRGDDLDEIRAAQEELTKTFNDAMRATKALNTEVFEQPDLGARDVRSLVDVLTRLRRGAGDF